MHAPHLPRMLPAGRFRNRLPRPRRLAAAAGLGVASTLILQPLALAHVSVTPGTATTGERTTVAFHVPNERDDASTTRIEVHFPEDHPLASVIPQAVPGWTIKVGKEKLSVPGTTMDGMTGAAVTSIVWEGGQIPPGTFAEFPVQLGPLPVQPGVLEFETLQTYSDGQVTRWTDHQQEGQPEPGHPAPMLTVAQPASAPAASESTTGATALWLGSGGLAAGLAALAWTGLRGRKAASPEPKVVQPHEKVRA